MEEFVKNVEKGGEYKILESSGASKIYFFKNSQDIYQVYNHKPIVTMISSFMQNLLLKDTEYRILFQKGLGRNKEVLFDKKIVLKPFSYIVPFNYYINDFNLICWKKINTINSIKEKKSFILTNLDKLLYDISKGLTIIHSHNKVHGDLRLDNIGFLTNFMIFDFDSMVNEGERDKVKEDDYKTLLESIKYHTDLDIKDIKSIGDVVKYVSKKKDITYRDAYEYLERLNILL